LGSVWCRHILNSTVGKEPANVFEQIAEHSRSEVLANGLAADRMAEHVETIRKTAKRIKGIKVLASTEVDILADGQLDYPDELLAECDIVTASIHSGIRQNRAKVTRRTIAAIQSLHLHIIGPPTRRLLGQREALDLDMDAVARAAVETGTALEVNALWQRLNLCDLHVRQAPEAGATLAICTDGHSVEGMLVAMPYGIATARRGWATRDDVLNAQPIGRLKAFVNAKK
jgi:DNA polymerase (family X)